MQTIIIDNFLPYPNIIRQWALNQQYLNDKEYTAKIDKTTTWPGVRTEHVMELDMDYANVVLGRFVNYVNTLYPNPGKVVNTVQSYFQLCSAADGDSWVHQDNCVFAAGILYLSPNPPPDSGTILYRCKDLRKWNSLHISDMMKINRLEKKDLYDSLFEPIDSIGNVYNRLVIYSGDAFHKSNNYFGSNREDSRLTQVFFAKTEQ